MESNNMNEELNLEELTPLQREVFDDYKQLQEKVQEALMPNPAERGVKDIEIGGHKLQVRFNASQIIAVDKWAKKQFGETPDVMKELIISMTNIENGGRINYELIVGVILIGVGQKVQKELKLTESMILDWFDRDDFDLQVLLAALTTAYGCGRPDGKKYVKRLLAMQEDRSGEEPEESEEGKPQPKKKAVKKKKAAS